MHLRGRFLCQKHDCAIHIYFSCLKLKCVDISTNWYWNNCFRSFVIRSIVLCNQYFCDQLSRILIGHIASRRNRFWLLTSWVRLGTWPWDCLWVLELLTASSFDRLIISQFLWPDIFPVPMLIGFRLPNQCNKNSLQTLVNIAVCPISNVPPNISAEWL